MELIEQIHYTVILIVALVYLSKKGGTMILGSELLVIIYAIAFFGSFGLAFYRIWT